MDQAGRHRVVVFAERIVVFAGAVDIFRARHDVRAAQRFARVVQAHQAGVIGRDAHGQRAFMALDGGALVLGQPEDARQLFQRADAGADLPAPVVPFRRRGAGIEAAIECAGIWSYGEAKRGFIFCRCYACDCGRFLERSFGG